MTSTTQPGRGTGNSRNGTRSKTVLTDVGPVEIDVPRDRDASFEPKIVAKRQKRLGGVDEMVISLAAKGLTTGEISAHLAEVYGAEVSRQTISTITDKVVEGMIEWQNRPVYPVIFIDAIHVKIRALSPILWWCQVWRRRLRSRSSPARPNIWRLSILKVTWNLAAGDDHLLGCDHEAEEMA